MMFSDLASIGAGIDAGGRLQDAAPSGAGAAAPIEGAEPGHDFAALLGLFLTAPEAQPPDAAPQTGPSEHLTLEIPATAPHLDAPALLTAAFEPAAALHAATHDAAVVELTAPSPGADAPEVDAIGAAAAPREATPPASPRAFEARAEAPRAEAAAHADRQAPPRSHGADRVDVDLPGAPPGLQLAAASSAATGKGTLPAPTAEGPPEPPGIAKAARPRVTDTSIPPNDRHPAVHADAPAVTDEIAGNGRDEGTTAPPTDRPIRTAAHGLSAAALAMSTPAVAAAAAEGAGAAPAQPPGHAGAVSERPAFAGSGDRGHSAGRDESRSPSHGSLPLPQVAVAMREGTPAAVAFPELTAPLAGASGVAEAEAPVRQVSEPPDLMPQLIRSIRMQSIGDIGHARVQLRPEHLGEVLVDLRVEHGEVIASLKAEVAEVREWIQARVDELRTALQAQGLQLAHLAVADHEGRREPHPRQTPPNQKSKITNPKSRSPALFELSLSA